MLIEYGFRIGIETYQPTPVLARLDVHPERRQDITFERNLSLSGRDAALPQLDLYGNLSRRFTLYPGVTAIELRGSILDSGLYERQLDHQGALAVDALPPEILCYLVASRYCETDLLSPMAWQLFGHLSEGAARVRAVADFVHGRLTFGYRFARDTRTVPVSQYSSSLCERISGRHRRAGESGSDGFQRMGGSLLGGRLVYGRCPA